MGEATYYCKLKFKDEEQASINYPKIKEYFAEGMEASDFWQENRGKDEEQFWLEFEKNFPLIYRYVKEFHPNADCNNGLSGALDFGDEIEDLTLNENEVWYFAYVWHFADWEPLLDFICNMVGAEYSWLSDEYAELFDLL